jgi:hypothetical protein
MTMQACLLTMLMWASAAARAEPQPRPSAPPSPAVPDASPETAVPERTPQELQAMLGQGMDKARAEFRRAARTSSSPATRAYALQALGAYDPSPATARVCVRALGTDASVVGRRAGAECLGRLNEAHAKPHTAALVAALDDPSLDVQTMAGWALAASGDVAAYHVLEGRTAHPDGRVAALFVGYVERMRARIDASGTSATVELPPVAVDADGNTLVPPGFVMADGMFSFERALSVSWLATAGAVAGWTHGALMATAHGGSQGGVAAPIAGVVAMAAGAALAGSYAFIRAPRLQSAHLAVQMAAAGAMVGFGAGQFAAQTPLSGVAAADLSLMGSLAGFGVAAAMTELGVVPTPTSLLAGLVVGSSSFVMAGSLASAYGLPNRIAQGGALVMGGVAASAVTLALRNENIGLYPLVGSAVGAALLGGGAGVLATVLEPSGTTTGASGYMVAGGVGLGLGAGALIGAMLPGVDPFRGLGLVPQMGAVAAAHGTAVPTLALAGVW